MTDPRDKLNELTARAPHEAVFQAELFEARIFRHPRIVRKRIEEGVIPEPKLAGRAHWWQRSELEDLLGPCVEVA